MVYPLMVPATAASRLLPRSGHCTELQLAIVRHARTLGLVVSALVRGVVISLLAVLHYGLPRRTPLSTLGIPSP